LWKFTPEQWEDLRIQARAEIVRRYAKEKNILEWGKLLFPEKFPLPFCQEFHGYLVKVRKSPFSVLEAPRNHSKTTIQCFLIKIFQALEEPKEFRHYLSVQKTESKALSINTTIKTEIETNELLRIVYGDMKGQGRWTDQQFALKNGVAFSSIGAGQSVRGTNYLNIRPDYIDVDDLYDEEDINNIESTAKKNQWFWSSLFPCRAKSKNYVYTCTGDRDKQRGYSKSAKGKRKVDIKNVSGNKRLEEKRSDFGKN